MKIAAISHKIFIFLGDVIGNAVNFASDDVFVSLDVVHY